MPPRIIVNVIFARNEKETIELGVSNNKGISPQSSSMNPKPDRGCIGRAVWLIWSFIAYLLPRELGFIS